MEASHRAEELQPTNLEASVAVLTVEMRYVRAGIDDLKTGQTRSVSRNEWEQRNGHVDGRFAQIEKEASARRMPWPSVGAFIVAAAVLLLNVVEKFGT